MLVFWAIDSAFSHITLIETATPDFLFSLNQSVRSFSSSGYAGRRYRFARLSFGASLSFSQDARGEPLSVDITITS